MVATVMSFSLKRRSRLGGSETLDRTDSWDAEAGTPGRESRGGRHQLVHDVVTDVGGWGMPK
jgi:hypothetical protein